MRVHTVGSVISTTRWLDGSQDAQCQRPGRPTASCSDARSTALRLSLPGRPERERYVYHFRLPAMLFCQVSGRDGDPWPAVGRSKLSVFAVAVMYHHLGHPARGSSKPCCQMPVPARLSLPFGRVSGTGCSGVRDAIPACPVCIPCPSACNTTRIIVNGRHASHLA